ncbi:MAG: hypothetical protein ACI9KM_002822, partial [Rubritalea sp.]
KIETSYPQLGLYRPNCHHSGLFLEPLTKQIDSAVTSSPAASGGSLKKDYCFTAFNTTNF